jgi:hypothetical protein
MEVKRTKRRAPKRNKQRGSSSFLLGAFIGFAGLSALLATC